jgi:hypothetical protein
MDGITQVQNSEQTEGFEHVTLEFNFNFPCQLSRFWGFWTTFQSMLAYVSSSSSVD